MNLDLIVQASLPTVRETKKPVGPTLMIGLGGTGKEVLLRLRRKIVERYGKLDRLPFLQFMHVDTDTTPAALEQYDLRSSDDPLYDEIRFTTAERVGLTIPGGSGKYIEHINNFPQIKRWFPTAGKIAQLGDLGEGAGQVRIASRLGFFDSTNHRNITGRLEQCRQNLTDAAIQQQAAQLGFEYLGGNIKVVIIASLAGGTGSGTFLDMAALANRYFGNGERIGILLLPGFFSGYPGADRVRANGYAALMELNHYSFGRSFLGDWDGHDRTSLPPPPFTSTYLIEGQNEAKLTIGSSGKEYDAYRMVAEVLFQDYSLGQFAGMKRATRVNLENFNLNVYTHNFLNDALRKGGSDTQKNVVGDTYPTRFGSFGLTTIAFPTERVQNACASRMATRILEYWQQSVIDDPLEHLFTKFLAEERVKAAQGRHERRDGGGVIERSDIEDALLVYDSGGGRTFPNFLWHKAQSMRADLQATPNHEKAARLAQHRAELDQYFAYEDSETPNEWGMGVRQIETNMRAYLQRVKAGIEELAAELSNDARYGVAYTLSLLRELKAILGNKHFHYVHYFDEQIQVWRDATQYYSAALDQLQLDVGRHENQFLFRAADLHRDYEKLVGNDGDEDLGAFYNHFVARVRKQVAKRGRHICDELDRFLGPDAANTEGLLGRYYDLLLGFEKLKERLRAKERYFSTPEKSDLFFSLYREGDVDEWYRTWLGEPPDEIENLKTRAARILNDIFQVDSVTAALVHIQRTPPETVEASILEHCRAFIAAQPKQPEALAMLFDASRFDVKKRNDIVGQAYRLSKVWLARGERGLEHTGLPPVSAQQRQCLIGLDDTTRFNQASELKKLVSDVLSPGDTPPTFLTVGEQHRGTIVFYSELAGVPAFYPSSVTAPRGLRASYNAFPEKEELHTDKNRFQFIDLIPKEPADARRYAESLQAFVLARVLGLVHARHIGNDGDAPVFRFSYARAVDQLVVDDVDLGGEAHAVDFLYRDTQPEHLTHRRYLLDEVQKVERALRDERKLAVYRLLLELYLTRVYPPRTMDKSDSSNVTLTQYTPEYAVLHQARERLSQFVGTEAEQFRTAYASLTGKTVNEPLTYGEFRRALEPYCKPCGKYPDVALESLHEKIVWQDVFALDLKKISKKHAKSSGAPVQKPAPVAATPDRSFGERDCPKCGRAIDRRAIYCTHCKETIAEHVPCPNCREPRVPSDLELCWSCGQKMREEERIECSRCFSWQGYANELPCPNCGFDPDADAVTAAVAGTPVLPISTRQERESAFPGGGNGHGESPADLTDAFPIVTMPAARVQCPICYDLVDPGALCAVCGGVLPEIR